MKHMHYFEQSALRRPRGVAEHVCTLRSSWPPAATRIRDFETTSDLKLFDLTGL